MKMDRATLSAIALALVLNVAAGVISFFLTKDVTTIAVTLAVTELLVLLELARRLVVRPRIPGVVSYSSASPVGGELLNIVSAVSTEFTFWGISAKTIIHSDDFRKIMIDKARGNARFRFLILDPESSHVAKRAAEEGDTPVGWKREIEANIDRLQRLRDQHGLTIEIGLYDSSPVFRLMFVNGSRLYFGWYPRGSQGFHSPLLVADNSTNSIYDPIRVLIEDVWTTAKKV